MDTNIDPDDLHRWILIHEPQSRWAAAVRAALSRRFGDESALGVASTIKAPPVESLAEVDRPTLVGMEITAANLREQLARLTMLRDLPLLCLVGLLDRHSLAVDLAAARLVVLQGGGGFDARLATRSLASRPPRTAARRSILAVPGPTIAGSRVARAAAGLAVCAVGDRVRR